MMQTKKSPDCRQNNKSHDLKIVHGGRPTPLDPPEHIRAGLKERWAELWESALGGVWDVVTDVSALERIFSLYELRLLAHEAVTDDGMTVKGAAGQPVDHPLIRRMKEYDGEIRHLEDRLGLSPKARLNLGIKGTDLRRPLSRLNAGLKADLDDPRDG